jgi:hypothetical protein
MGKLRGVGALIVPSAVSETLAGMRLGGIDPSILRELSGVYKPFVKAFKELISNAFDADADAVIVEFSEDFSSATVRDDGRGMTPFEFRNDFTRIGGGSRRWGGDRTPKSRLRIGSKGIGFLAVARYCGRLEVESSGERSFLCEFAVGETPAPVEIWPHLGIPIPETLLGERLKITVKRRNGKKLREHRDYRLDRRKRKLLIGKKVGPVRIRIRFDCRGLGFRSVLDFDRLLELADRADLDKIDDFASIAVYPRPPEAAAGTRITVSGIKSFVQRELRSERRKGYVRNVESLGGLEKFIWQLSRCTPVSYLIPSDSRGSPDVSSHLKAAPNSTLNQLEVRHSGKIWSLHRRVYPLEELAARLNPDTFVELRIKEAGLHAVGFIAGYEAAIFPAEYRGITVRVRGVAIGDPGFFGAEHLLAGAQKAVLSQITGEINILAGLDAIDTLNPGRESFYEESGDYKILRRELLGEGEQISGYLGRAVAAVLRRSQIGASLKNLLARAAQRRRALDEASAAITHLVVSGDAAGEGLRNVLSSGSALLNGLSAAEEFEVGPPPRIAGFATLSEDGLPERAVIDYEREIVLLDLSRPEWDRSLVFFDRIFKVVYKKGAPDQAVANIDPEKNLVLVNWNHPARMQMEEKAFLRTALAWIVAREAANGNADYMMDLALKLVSFSFPDENDRGADS